MAEVTTGGSEQDCLTTDQQDEETGKTGKEEQAVEDPKQGPGDKNENGTGIDMNGGHGATEERGIHSSLASEARTETISPTEQKVNGEEEIGVKLCESGESPVRGASVISTEYAQEGSLVLKQEQREESVSTSPPAHRTKTAEKSEHGTKRRAGGELPASDGEPLSRMDSEDRSVEVVCSNDGPLMH